VMRIRRLFPSLAAKIGIGDGIKMFVNNFVFKSPMPCTNNVVFFYETKS